MTTSVYPAALDQLPNPLPTDNQKAVGHAELHTQANDAIEAIQAALGTAGNPGALLTGPAAGAVAARIPAFFDYLLPGVTPKVALANANAAGVSQLRLTTAVAMTEATDFGALQIADGGGSLAHGGFRHTLSQPVAAASRQIFDATDGGNFYPPGDVNAAWWGAVSGLPPAIPPQNQGETTAAYNARVAPNVAANLAFVRANTRAFRKALKSYYADAAFNTGTVAAPSGANIAWRGLVQAAYYLANGFAAPTGIPVVGTGISAMLVRRGESFDPNETAIPLLTIGQTLAPDLSYQVDPAGYSAGPYTKAGVPGTASECHNMAFFDQNPVGALRVMGPGALFSRLQFIQCALALSLRNTIDVAGTDFIADEGLTHLSLESVRNVNLKNFRSFNPKAQGISIGSNIFDTTIDVDMGPLNQLGINFGQGATRQRDLHFSGRIYMAAQPAAYSDQNPTGFIGATVIRSDDVKATFENFTWQNCKGSAIRQTLYVNGKVFIIFRNCTIDGDISDDLPADGQVYVPSTDAAALDAVGGTYIFVNCHFENLKASGKLTFGNLTVIIGPGCTMGPMPGYTGEIFNVKGSFGSIVCKAYAPTNGVNPWFARDPGDMGSTIIQNPPLTSISQGGTTYTADNGTGLVTLPPQSATNTTFSPARAGNTETNVDQALRNSASLGTSPQTFGALVTMPGLQSLGTTILRNPGTAATTIVATILDPNNTTNTTYWNGQGDQVSIGKITAGTLQINGASTTKGVTNTGPFVNNGSAAFYNTAGGAITRVLDNTATMVVASTDSTGLGTFNGGLLAPYLQLTTLTVATLPATASVGQQRHISNGRAMKVTAAGVWTQEAAPGSGGPVVARVANTWEFVGQYGLALTTT